MDVRRTRSPRAATVAGLALLLAACEPSAGERERMARLAEVEKIAVATMAGKASVAPESRLYRGFMDDLLAAFEEAARETPPLVEFLPIDSAVNDPAYRAVAKIALPEGTYSPVTGLTYVSTGTEGGFDCEPLVRSLGADALLLVVVDFGADVRNNGSTFYLTADVASRLVSPPEFSLWEGPSTYEEMLPVTLFTHPKLVGGIGAKWVVMAKPSAEDYSQLMDIAADNRTTLPSRIGSSIVRDIVQELEKARARVTARTPR